MLQMTLMALSMRHDDEMAITVNDPQCSELEEVIKGSFIFFCAKKALCEHVVTFSASSEFTMLA